MRRILLISLAGIALVAACLGAWYATRPREVAVLARESGVAVVLYGLGSVDAERVSRTAFEVGGLIAEMRLRVGDHIVAGERIARLDSRRQELRVAAASDDLALAEATARQSAARAGGMTATVMLKRQVAARARALENRGAGPVALAADAEADLAVAVAGEAESQRAIEVASAAVKRSRTALEQEREELVRHVLLAPFDAVVTERLAVEGDVVQAGQPVVTLADSHSLRVVALVSEAQAGMLAAGQPAAILLRSRPDQPLAGHIDRIRPASDPVAEERSVSVLFDRLPETLYLAEQAEIRVQAGNVENALLVPERAVRNRDSGSGTVWAVSDGRLAELRVGFGRQLPDGRLEIVSPLPDGVAILAARLPGARAGEAVRIVTATPP
jgi:HlyD family secretion protein